MAFTPGGGAVISFSVEGAPAAVRQVETIGGAFDHLAGVATAGIATLAAGFAAMKIGDYAKDATLLAARYETLGIVMHTAGQNAGYTSAQMDVFAKGLENSGISMVKSREALTSMTTAQLDLNKSQELGRLAQNLAVVANKNSSDTLTELITNIQQADTEGLKYMGIILNQGEALEKYAAAHGTVSKALTQTQKSEAVQAAVMQQGAKYAGIYEQAMGTAGKALNSLDRYFENIKVRLGTPFLEGFAKGVFGVTDGVKQLNIWLDKVESNGAMEKVAKSIGSSVGTVISVIKDIAGAAGDIGSALVSIGKVAADFFDKYLGGMTTVKAATIGFALLLSGFLVEQATIGFAAVSTAAWASALKVGAAFLAMGTAATNTFRLMQLSAAALGWGPAIAIAGRTALAAIATAIGAIPGAIGAATVAAGVALGYLLVKGFGDTISKGVSAILPKFIDNWVDEAAAYAVKKIGNVPEVSEAVPRATAGNDAKAAANKAEAERKEQLMRSLNMSVVAAEGEVSLVSATNTRMKALDDLRDQQLKQSLDQRIITQVDYLAKKEKMDVAEAQGQLNQISAQKAVLAAYMAASKAGAPLGQGRDPAADANEMTKLLGDEAAAQIKLNAVKQSYAHEIASAMLESYTKEFGSISSIVDAQEALVRSTRVTYQEAGKTAEQREMLAAQRESDAAAQLSSDLAARKSNGTATKEYVANTDAMITALNQMSVARLKATASDVSASFLNDAKAMRDETTTLYADMRNTFIGTDEERIRSAAQTSIRLAAIRKADANAAIDKTGDSDLQKLAAKQKVLGGFNTYVDAVNANADAKIAQTAVGFRTLADVMNSAFDPTRVQQFGSAMQSALGGAGGAVGGLVDAMNNYTLQQNALAAARTTASQNYANDQKKLAAATQAINLEQTRSTLGYYSNIAGAAKGFFNENSKGYKVLQDVQMAFHAVETALAIKAAVEKIAGITAVTTAEVTSAGTKVAVQTGATATSVGLAGTEASAWGVTAVAKAIASLPFPLNLAAGAATLAAIVGLGVKMIGGLGGSSVSTSEQRQAAQGTGTVLGDSSAKSDSIAKSIELTASNSSTQINYLSGMLTALKSIQTGIGNFSAELVKTTNVANPDVGSLSHGYGTSNMGAVDMTATGAEVGMYWGPIGAAVGAVAGYIASKIPVFQNLFTSIMGGKQTVDDSGFTVAKESLGDITKYGAAGYSYADVKTSGGLFGSDSIDPQYYKLSTDANRQFTDIIGSLGTSIKEAGKLLGIDGASFTAELNGYVVDIGKVSLKGLSPDDQQKALEAVFSKLGDQMAQAAIPDLTKFQQVGEGYLQTLVRVASDYAKVDASLQSINATFGQTGVASIGARESLIALLGGIDDFQSKTADYAQNFLTKAQQLAPVQAFVTGQLQAMGEGWIKTRTDFAAEIASLSGKLDDPQAQQTYAALMNLESAFAAVTPAIEDTTKSLQDIADERKDLQDQYDQLAYTSTQLLAKQRAALDASNRSLFDQIQIVQKAKDANDAAKTSLSSFLDQMKGFATTAAGLNKSLLLSDLTTLTPEQQLAEARRQYEQTKQKALANDSTAQGQLQAVEQAFLKLDQLVNGGDATYSSDLAGVMKDNEQFAAMAASQVSIAQQQLDALNQIASGVTSIQGSIPTMAPAELPVDYTSTSSFIPTMAPAELPVDYLGGNSATAGSGAPRVARQAAAVSPVNYSTMSAPNNDALEAEVTALRASNEAMVNELKGLRDDMREQTGVKLKAAGLAAQHVAEAATNAGGAVVKSIKQTESAIA